MSVVFRPDLPLPLCTVMAPADCLAFVSAARVCADTCVLLGFDLVGTSLSEKKLFLFCVNVTMEKKRRAINNDTKFYVPGRNIYVLWQQECE